MSAAYWLSGQAVGTTRLYKRPTWNSVGIILLRVLLGCLAS